MSNVLSVLKGLLYTLERQYGSKVRIGRYIVGEIDYGGDPTRSNTTDEHPIKAIKLPTTVARLFAKQTKVSFETYNANYIIKFASAPFILKPDQYIIDNIDGRYNIKKVEAIENYCYLVGADSVLGETHE